MDDQTTKKSRWTDPDYAPTEIERLRDVVEDCQHWHAMKAATDYEGQGEHSFRAKVLFWVLKEGLNWKQAIERWSAEHNRLQRR